MKVTCASRDLQVVGNSGFIVPDKAFLQGLRDIATQYGAVLCFDEVMTVRVSSPPPLSPFPPPSISASIPWKSWLSEFNTAFFPRVKGV